MLTVSVFFVFDPGVSPLQNPQYYVRQFVLLCIVCGIAFVVLIWPKRYALLEVWRERVRPGMWRLPLAVNLALFAGLTFATIRFSQYAASVHQPPWGVYAAYIVPLAATGLSLVWLAAPAGAWIDLFRRYRTEVLLATAGGLTALIAGIVAQAGWRALSGATLRISYRLLTLYEQDVRVDYDRLLLGVGDFNVYVSEACSGYEGIGLVTAFLAMFLAVFRQSLKFPNALLLLPIGMGAIWLLNSVRIMALVSLGAHVSPEVAISGFHSQAGWVAFLLVTIGIMAGAPRIAFFAAEGGLHLGRPQRASDRLIVAFLAPFMCLMAAAIVTAASAPYDEWFYVLKVISVGVCLWVFRDVYRDLIAKVDPLSIACGAIVGIAWIVTAPTSTEPSEVGLWIADQSVSMAVLWLVFRAIGSIVMVPIAEELAFRGLLHRWLISRRFEAVDYAAFSWVAFVVSSLLFGFMHQRWIAGTLAGAAFALTMYRSGRLSDPIAAHMIANAIIVIWAVALQDWSLL
jgi:exosortase E/protease (VPEID-CTERM system)